MENNKLKVENNKKQGEIDGFIQELKQQVAKLTVLNRENEELKGVKEKLKGDYEKSKGDNIKWGGWRRKRRCWRSVDEE